MTMAVNIFRCILDRFCDQCIRFFPCLANPVVVVRFLYTALYLVFFVATLVQFLLTSGSSPGYVVDAMRALNEREALLRAASVDST
ncbi:hypothetical protein V2J09_021545 [Rumex salicifolius]